MKIKCSPFVLKFEIYYIYNELSINQYISNKIQIYIMHKSIPASDYSCSWSSILKEKVSHLHHSASVFSFNKSSLPFNNSIYCLVNVSCLVKFWNTIRWSSLLKSITLLNLAFSTGQTVKCCWDSGNNKHVLQQILSLYLYFEEKFCLTSVFKGFVSPPCSD